MTTAAATPVTHTFEVKEYRVPEFHEKLAKLQKRAAKLGLTPLTLVSLGTTEKVSYNGPEKIVTPYAKFAVTTETALKLAGWSLLGVIDYTVAGVIIREVPGQTVPASFRTDDATCAHCQTARYRKQTFVVAHEDGRVQRVGRNCLGDFLGVNPEQLLRSAEWTFEVTLLGGDYEDGAYSGSSRRVDTLSPKTWLALALRTTAKDGYISKAAAEAYAAKSGGEAQLQSTTGRTLLLLQAIEGRLPKFTGRYGQPVDQNKEIIDEYGRPEEADFAKAEQLLTYGKAVAGDSTYAYNLRTVCAAEFCTPKELGILVSVIGSWKREQEKVEAAKPAARPSEFLGTVGAKLTVTATVTKTTAFEGDYGARTLVLFKTAAGDVLKWWASGAKEDAFPVGTEVTLAATVKAHETFKDLKQTVLTRAKAL